VPTTDSPRASDAPRPPALALPRIALYAVGSLGTGLIAAVPGVLLPYYMTSVLGVSAALAGLGVFIPKFWDMLIDPVVGLLSDRTRSRWGRRRPWLLVGAFLAPLLFAFVFAGPVLPGPNAAFAYVVAMFLLSSTAYSVYGIPYIALPAEMSTDADERARIMAWRVAFVLGGLLIGSAAGPALVEVFGGGRAGYRGMGAALALVCCVVMLVVLGALRGLALDERRGPESPTRARAFANRPFTALVCVYVVQLVAMGGFSAALPYYAARVMGLSEGFVGTCMGVMFVVAIAVTPLWVAIAKRRGRAKSLRDSVLVFASAALALGVVPAPPTAFVLAMMAVLGVGFSGQQVFPFAMLTDTIRFDTDTTGLARAATFSGLFAAAEKAGLAFGPLVTGITLSATGFGNDALSPSAVAGIRLALGTVPAALMVLSVFLLRFYTLADARTAPAASVVLS
jgi:GPH family glycoside/pentoside/hexuronide:cation symporter